MNKETNAENMHVSQHISNEMLGGVIRPAKEMKIDIKDEVKVGDTTMFNVDGRMLAVEVVRLNHDGSLKLMSCDLEKVWERVDRSHWLRQVEFMKQLP